MASPLDLIFKTVGTIHIFLYRTSGGKIWNTMIGLPVLLLTTTGRKTGKERTSPVVFLRDGNDYLIAASAGGADKAPAWFGNLQSNPKAKIEMGGKTMNVNAVIYTGEERDRLYEIFKAASNNFVVYQQGTTRVIPVIRLQVTGV